MVFASLTFLAFFLPLTLLIYFVLRRHAWRNAWLVLVSLVFYAWGEPVWIILLLISAGVDYVHGLVITRYRGRAQARLAVVSSLAINLGLLGAFKYSGFLVKNINCITGMNWPEPSFALPLGISFYTFQTISYVIDVYRNQVPAQRTFWKFLLYVGMFPQLVAGPIVRYGHIMEGIEGRVGTLADVSHGVTRFCVGLFKKVAIANIAGELVGRYLERDLATLSTGEAWFGLLMFAIQIYFDFAGYSDMAIGLGRMFGFRFHENFDHPYISRSATEFWRRWHISLGTFFRDYLYISLGGNRRHPFRNLFIVWFLTGLWHGASWNFVLWGLYFGLLIAVERLVLKRLLDRLPAFVGHAYLLFAVLLSWGIFYFVDWGRMVTFFGVLFGANAGPWMTPDLAMSIRQHAFWLMFSLMLCTPLIPVLIRRGRHWLACHWPAMADGCGLTAYANLLMLLACVSMLVGKTFNPFLYFRF
jgi:alginate O-acetyltransferase complex protein AlgI